MLVAPGSFGTDLPRRALWLSPAHGVFVNGVLIPVRYLINDGSVMQRPCASVTYWHVELPKHSVLLAEGLPCESYLDTGNRSAFNSVSGPKYREARSLATYAAATSKCEP